jgi:hypothetical protein
MPDMPSEHRASRSLCSEYPNDNPGLHGGAIWRCAVLGDAPSCEFPLEARVEAQATSVSPDHDDRVFGEADSSTHETNEPLPDLESLVASVLALDSVSEESAFQESSPRPSPDVAPGERTVEEHAPEEAHALSSDPASGPPLDDGGFRSVDDDAFLDESDAPTAIEIVDELTFDPIDERPAAPDDPFLRLVSTLEEVALTLGAAGSCVATLRALFGVTRAGDLSPEGPAEEALIAGGLLVRSARGLARSNAFTAEVLAWQAILRGEGEDFSACGPATLDEWTANALARSLGAIARTDAIRKELRRRGVAAFGLVSVAA